MNLHHGIKSWIPSFACIAIATSMFVHGSAVTAQDDEEEIPNQHELVSGEEVSLSGGTINVFWSRQAIRSYSTALLVHFHGAPSVVAEQFAAGRFQAVVAVVNFNGLSSAYAEPFQDDTELFQTILEQVTTQLSESDLVDEESWKWQAVFLSSFSAGYGAVREILKEPGNFGQISGILAADSIYASLESESPKRVVDRAQMRDFLRFARLAVDEEKTFVITHSFLETPYASTLETADYLLASLGVSRSDAPDDHASGMRQVAIAISGQFKVLSFEGTTGEAHMMHLRRIGELWKELPLVQTR